MNKYFIITVDTEGDNLWDYKPGNIIETENAKYLKRFQSLCEEYHFKPVYLTNYEMASSEYFVNEAKEWLKADNCEVGVHLHAWNNPPIVDDNVIDTGCQYLIEYSESVMRQKFETIYNLIVENFGIKPVSHRAGRWAMDERYFRILNDFDVYVDCSHTPGINWESHIGSRIGGSNYSSASQNVSIINHVVEVPPTVRKLKRLFSGSIKHQLNNILTPDTIWLRPAMCNLKSMKKLIDVVSTEKDTDYLEFMIHSSEVMPSGSPYFKTDLDIDKEFDVIRSVFEYATNKGYVGITLKDYVKTKGLR